MLSIYKNQSNTVFLTLSERATISSPRYFLRFEDKEKNTYSYCLLGSDSSGNIERGNRFNIADQALPNPNLSQVNLSVGEYYYTAYQLTAGQAAAINFNTIDISIYTDVEGPCKMKVFNPEESNTYYEGPVINTVYEG